MFNKIYFSKIKEKAIIPSKKKENAGYDFYACFDEDYVMFEEFETKCIPTGIAWASSPKYFLQLKERSSTGLKAIKVSAGVVDSGYRGDISICIFNATRKKLVLSNLSEEEFYKRNPIFNKNEILFYSTKKAIAQGVIFKVEKLKIKVIDYISLKRIKSDRGDKRFGSSNKN